MFIKPQYGWTTLTTPLITDGNNEKINWDISYTTNVPVEVLSAFINFYKTYMPQVVEFDMEEDGYGCMVISHPSNIHLFNSFDNLPVIYQATAPFAEVVQECIDDFQTNIDEWATFYFSITDEEEYKKNKDNIISLINELKHISKKG